MATSNVSNFSSFKLVTVLISVVLVIACLLIYRNTRSKQAIVAKQTQSTQNYVTTTGLQLLSAENSANNTKVQEVEDPSTSKKFKIISYASGQASISSNDSSPITSAERTMIVEYLAKQSR